MADGSAIRTDVASIVGSRDAFDAFVYTPLDEALDQLIRRRANTDLAAYVTASLPGGIPEAMRPGPSAALFRQLATPNYEVRHFASTAAEIPGFEALVLEFRQDRFNNRNDWKYFLGRVPFHKGASKRGDPIIEHVTVIDFNASANQPLTEVRTLWGEPLVDFHHGLLRRALPAFGNAAVDISPWLAEQGSRARDFYKGVLTLFVRDAILFENFLFETSERAFTRDVVLPALLDIMNACGVKPLIVALEPIEVEGDLLWFAHRSEFMADVMRKQRGAMSSSCTDPTGAIA